MRLHDNTRVTFHEMFEVILIKTSHHPAPVPSLVSSIRWSALSFCNSATKHFSSKTIMVVEDSKVSFYPFPSRGTSTANGRLLDFRLRPNVPVDNLNRKIRSRIPDLFKCTLTVRFDTRMPKCSEPLK